MEQTDARYPQVRSVTGRAAMRSKRETGDGGGYGDDDHRRRPVKGGGGSPARLQCQAI